jgi:hypothetical protein
LAFVFAEVFAAAPLTGTMLANRLLLPTCLTSPLVRLPVLVLVTICHL